MKIVSLAGNIEVGRERPCIVIAELGAMYEDIDGMKELIRLSKEAGADMVKVQTFRAETISARDARLELEDGTFVPQCSFLKKYEISADQHRALFDYAKKIGIAFFSTPSYYDDVDFLDQLGVLVFKTGSDDLTNYPFLEYIAKKGKPMIVSTGMSTLEEIEKAVDTILGTANDQLILLHCIVSYPVKAEYANLNIINTLKERFKVPIGYSDHVPGIFSSVLAVSMGACVIEKHVTLNRTLKRPDYQASLEPQELKELVRQIRLIPILKGSTIRKVYPTEEKWRRNLRKSLVAARQIEKGEVIKREDIKIIRPGTGLPPCFMESFLGKYAQRKIMKDENLSEDSVSFK